MNKCPTCGLSPDANLCPDPWHRPPAPEARDGSIEHTLRLMESAKPVMLDEVAAARAELRRLRDYELMLRAIVEPSPMKAPPAELCRTRGGWVLELYRDDEPVAEFLVHDDGTGLPLLDDAARRALGGGK